ncbi:MAG: aminotransferase DegT [Epulopiscium sp. Nele67-Bin004]|nr:MAG: aminotransferase DegT [Epulopiscium sp. Nele67-Bin004]
MNKFIPLSVPNLKGNELKYVTDAIQKEWVSTGGMYINMFEEKLAEYVGSSCAVACQSGTAGLHLVLLEAGVTAADEVIVPALTFIAAVNPVRYVGASPVFMDCDDTLCMDMDKLQKFIDTSCEMKQGNLYNKTTNKRIKAVIVVHVFGNLADMNKLVLIGKKYNLVIIEDATEALGTYYVGNGKKIFAGTIGDFGVFSFNGNKIITTGGGGMIVGKSGLDHIKYLSTQAKDDELYYTHDEIGYNYRMTNVQAGIGLAQLEQLETFIKTKQNNYELYKQLFEHTKIKLQSFRDDIRPNYWFYSLQLENQNISDTIKQLEANNIQTRPIWGLICDQKPYKQFQTFEVEKARQYQQSIINIPCSSNLTGEDVKYVAKKVGEIYE